MLLLPRTLGPLTLTRKLGTSSVTDSYLGVLAGETQQPVVARHVLPYLARDPEHLAQISARVRDLLGVRHPFLVRVRDWLEDGEDRFIIEDQIDGISLEMLLHRCRQQGMELPHNVYLNFATQLCNGLEALHGRPGKGSGVDNVLHLRLRPSAVHITREGKVVLGGYGLVRSPTILPHADGTNSPVPVRLEHLSPEQTRPNEDLAPTSDIFSLGTLLYEMLTLDPLFRGQSNIKTLQRIQAAQIEDELSIARAHMPGLDKILQRALTAEARLRYQRAFVLREDLRGLMANYSFSTIVQDTRQFLEAFLRPSPDVPPEAEASSSAPPATPEDETTLPAEAVQQLRDAAPPLPEPLDFSGEPESTAEIAARSLARRSALAFEDDDSVPLAPLPTITPASSDDLTDEEERDDLDLADMNEAFDPPTRDEEADPPPPYEDFEADPDSIILPRGAEPPPAPRALSAPTPLPPILPPLPIAPIDAAEPAEEAPEPTTFISDAAPPVLPPHRDTAPPVQPIPEPVLLDAAEPVPRPRPRPPHVAPPVVAEEPSAPEVTEVTAAPTPTPAVEEPEDLDWRPRRSGISSPMIFGIAALVGSLVCGGGGYGLLTLAAHMGTPAEPSGEVVASTPPPPPPPVEEPEAVAAAPAEVAPEAVAAVVPKPRTEIREAPPAPAQPIAARTGAGAGAGASVSSSRETAPRPTPSEERPVSTTASARRTEETRDRADAFAFLEDTSPEPTAAAGVETLAAGSLDMERYASQASRGALGRTEMMALESVGLEDTNYTRSRALLLMDAQRRGDTSASQRYLDQLMYKPENRYNPIYLTDAARLKVNRGDYAGALQEANLAERHWARLPSDLIFLKKAEIYEIQAAAYQGLFYASEDDMDLLLKSIRSWERYREHVNSRARSDMAGRAERELTKLEDVRQRLEY